ncbi:NUDIX hydrolase [Modestobacter sp. I12A-02628]|uniref:NUDIX domain-containing protein n=1 Tax=Goekera deserti TaxID=2497753 RepID=A0A7K3WEV3_9ACTN|nr:NUDIX domain-containing protein [Goekera deserti]MPQ98047.1 NUDIX hydrolase [Goekera deserti]NDI48694.1 NUDIX domain-containing protein [Goekera deserti]NEL54927.1 NUDIX domain-containing protein [Goekera deserti]
MTAPLRQAATVLLVRDGEPGLEVYLLRRTQGMPFAGGMTAYPGGGVDPRDADTDVEWVGPTPADWAVAWGCDERTARQLVCAAVRETFEEAGVLLAGSTAGEVVPDVSGADWEAQRQALLARETSLAELLAGRGLAVRADLLRPFAHWVTPPGEQPRRYDTKFFAAAMPLGQEARDVSGEADEAVWTTPAAALAEYEAGTRPMLPPTVHTLGQVGSFADVAAVLAGSPPEPLAPIMPSFAVEPDGSWAVLPDGTRIRMVVPLTS